MVAKAPQTDAQKIAYLEKQLEWYKAQAAKEKQRADFYYKKDHETLQFERGVMSVPNKAASPIDKLVIIEIYIALRSTPRHDLQNGRVKMFSSWLAERLGMNVKAIQRSVYRLAELNVIDADFSQTFKSNQAKGNGASIEVTIWYLGLYDDTIDRLMHAMEVAPRNHGGSRIWCTHCAKEVDVIIVRRGHERKICSCCERTLIECDFKETIARGKVEREETNEQNHAQEASDRKAKAKHLVLVPVEDVDFPTELDDLPINEPPKPPDLEEELARILDVSETPENHPQNGKVKYASPPSWLTPGTKDWQKQVAKNGLKDMIERRKAWLEQEGNHRETGS